MAIRIPVYYTSLRVCTAPLLSGHLSVLDLQYKLHIQSAIFIAIQQVLSVHSFHGIFRYYCYLLELRVTYIVIEVNLAKEVFRLSVPRQHMSNLQQ